jgi:hypothetical protein
MKREGVQMGGKELTDLRVMQESIRVLGVRRSASLIGYCAILAAYGVETRADILGSKVMSLETRYRVLRDVRRVRDHLRALGYDVSPDQPGESDGDEVAMVRLMAHAAAAA